MVIFACAAIADASPRCEMLLFVRLAEVLTNEVSREEISSRIAVIESAATQELHCRDETE